MNLKIELGEGVLDLLKTHRIGSLAARPISSLLRGLLKPAGPSDGPTRQLAEMSLVVH